jgi:heptosyltransferase-2
LVIKLVGVGDTVLMLTPLSRLRQRFPNARICALVTPLSSGVLADDPRIDETIVYDVLGAGRGPAGLLKMVRTLRRMKFDCVIDFEQHFHCTTLLAYFSGAPTRVGFFFRPAGRGLLYSAPVFLDPDKHMVEAFTDLLAPLGIERARVDRLEPVQVSQQDRDAVSGWLRASGIAEGEVLVGIHPGSGPRSPQRQWGAKNFADIARMIRDKSGAQVVVTGTAEERSLADEIVRLAARPGVRSAAGRFTLKQVAALLARCSLFVSTDTGPMHISASVGTPTVGIFGPQTARRYAPFGRGNAAVWKPTACSPCVQIHEGRTYDCKDAACIDGIGLAEVWAEVEQRLPLRAGE